MQDTNIKAFDIARLFRFYFLDKIIKQVYPTMGTWSKFTNEWSFREQKVMELLQIDRKCVDPKEDLNVQNHPRVRTFIEPIEAKLKQTTNLELKLIDLRKMASDRLSMGISLSDRFCSQILPKIHHHIEWLNVESPSMARILLSTNYPNLYGLGLYNLEQEMTEHLFSDHILLLHTFKSQILSLVVNMSPNDKPNKTESINRIIFTNIFNMFINLQRLNFVSSSIWYQMLSFHNSPPTIFSANLLELHVSLENFIDCLYLLDECFNQLRTLHVNINKITRSQLIENKGKLLNLRCFVLYCDLFRNAYDELIVPLLDRMLNLEELSLTFEIVGRNKFIDGNNLKDIIDHMVQLKKFASNIHSSIDLKDQIDLPSNENIQNTFRNFKHNRIVSCTDYFSMARVGQCHIYSYPYQLKMYEQITNSFPGGLFECVRAVSLFDERPFEHAFFLRIAQSFPLMEKLKLVNLKPQNNAENQNMMIEIAQLLNILILMISIYLKFMMIILNNF
ncbi:unnamed protein product [Rotaria socialis]|uniref:Uncharacterized protein n=2 Tax=Rotaria socialis TaxID=392032 RepID=A0A819BPR8_9BILA|nr:unnamed protein product [Rotaria socialis]CAF4866190.1 unnamed protein product [Rotaria socialis]